MRAGTRATAEARDRMARAHVRDFTGVRFGLWTVVSLHDHRIHPKWNVRCECGNEKVVKGRILVAGKSRSCGCQTRQMIGAAFRKHGLSGDPLHHLWRGMIARCHDSRGKSFENYGARGIEVCARWRTSFEAFRDDMGPRPSRLHSVDRIDNDKGYGPDNCRWATAGEQARNRRNNRLVTFEGETKTVSEWARSLGISHAAMADRLQKLDPATALTRPKQAVWNNQWTDNR